LAADIEPERLAAMSRARARPLGGGARVEVSGEHRAQAWIDAHADPQGRYLDAPDQRRRRGLVSASASSAG